MTNVLLLMVFMTATSFLLLSTIGLAVKDSWEFAMCAAATTGFFLSLVIIFAIIVAHEVH